MYSKRKAAKWISTFYLAAFFYKLLHCQISYGVQKSLLLHMRQQRLAHSKRAVENRVTAHVGLANPTVGGVDLPIHAEHFGLGAKLFKVI